ncbi:caspase family protein [Tardiphaga alba]|uniref:caspase family protein n=1 Tax=Tardiphaga alba TaxID=340268 RepID=UPI002013B320|nr:caspase family protein [Tardiphaga alba]
MVGPVIRNAVVAAAVMLGSQAAWAESRIALVIGQSAYKAVTPLPNPANDAKAMAAMLTDAGFEVQSASDLSQNELRAKISEFAQTVSAKGPDTVSLVFYAGHGVQVDGENYLMPVDIDPKREIDVTLQAVRLNDIINTLTTVPSKSRIILLDACRNNPFPGLAKTTPRGLAHVDVKFGTAGTLLSFSTAPGSEAEDGNGANSPYTTALLKAGREPGLPIEDAFKRVRLAVNQATEGRQTPWESSSLVSDFRFFGASASTNANSSAGGDTKAPLGKKSADDWKKDLKGKTIQQAHDMIVFDGSVEAYEAFVSLYAEPPFGPEARDWLDRHYRMVAWNIAVITNTVPAFETFLAKFPDSEQAPTARGLIERVRNKPVPVATAAAPTTLAALATPAPTCPCNAPRRLPPHQRRPKSLQRPTRRSVPSARRGARSSRKRSWCAVRLQPITRRPRAFITAVVAGMAAATTAAAVMAAAADTEAQS